MNCHSLGPYPKTSKVELPYKASKNIYRYTKVLILFYLSIYLFISIFATQNVQRKKEKILITKRKWRGSPK